MEVTRITAAKSDRLFGSSQCLIQVPKTQKDKRQVKTRRVSSVVREGRLVMSTSLLQLTEMMSSRSQGAFGEMDLAIRLSQLRQTMTMLQSLLKIRPVDLGCPEPVFEKKNLLAGFHP